MEAFSVKLVAGIKDNFAYVKANESHLGMRNSSSSPNLTHKGAFPKLHPCALHLLHITSGVGHIKALFPV